MMEAPRLDLSRVGQRLREIRMRRGENMNVALRVRRKFGVKIDASYLSRMERGRANIPLRTLFALAAYYGVDPADLVRGGGTPITEPVEEVFSIPELKLAFGTLFEDFGKKLFTELLWFYFRILARSTEIREDRQRAARQNLSDPTAAKRI